MSNTPINENLIFEPKEGTKLKELTDKYSVSVHDQPRLLLWGYPPTEGDGPEGILYFIKRCPEDQFIAHKIAQLLAKEGGKAEVMEVNHINPVDFPKD